MMKGKNKFTESEAVEIKRLLAKKILSNRQEQKKIRHSLRTRFGFYIEDFTRKKGFSDKDFEELIR